ncbi:MAG: MASE1 domain-containing protein [Verrucomicrobiia bacterium]
MPIAGNFGMAQRRQDGEASIPFWHQAVWFGLAFFACAELSSCLLVKSGPYETFWLPAGLYVGALLLYEYRAWPWLMLAALLANFAFDLLHGTKFLLILFFFSSGTLEAMTAAWLVRRFISPRPTLATLREFAGLLGFAAGLSALLGAIIGTLGLTVFGESHSFQATCLDWWADNAMAILLVTPLMLVWLSKPDPQRRWPNRPGKLLEAALLFTGLCAMSWHVFFVGNEILSPGKMRLIPFLLWAGVRFGPRGATAANLLLALLCAFFTAHFQGRLTPAEIASGEYVLILQTFLTVSAMVGLIPAIVLSERDRTLARLGESEERFRHLTQAAFEGIAISENGRILDMNDQGLRMFGCSRDEMIGREIVDLAAPESRPLVAEAVRTGREVVYEHQLLRKDGSVFYAEAQAKMVRIDHRALRMTALRDITGRKQAETALRASEESLRATIEHTPHVAVQWFDALGRVTFWNRASEHLYGWTAAEATGKTLAQLIFAPAETALFESALKEIERTGKAIGPREFPFHHRNGSHGVVLSTVFSIPVATGEWRFVCMDVDLTERKAAEAQRTDAVLREQQARTEYTLQLIASQEAERTRIAAELHDSLGQNLLLIKNRAQLALAGKEVPGILHEQLESISQLASQSIAEARQISHDLHPYQLDHLGLTRALAAMVDTAADSSGVVFEHQLQNVDDLFPKDAAMNLYRVVQECLNNILKHSGARRARLRLERDVHEVELHIEDDGSGFNAAGPEAGRRGLGLRNMAERVLLLGGKIQINSQPGQGTRVQVIIPVAIQK